MTHPRAGSPEQEARKLIDAALMEAGWVVQDHADRNLTAGLGVVIREFPLAQGHGYADYLLFVDGVAVGVLEAKPAGHTLSGVEPQATKYSQGLPAALDAPVRPLPFLYLSTGVVTKFTNLVDPDPRSRRLSLTVPHIHRPETLAEWLSAKTLDAWVKEAGFFTAAEETKPSTLRARLRAMPPLESGDLYRNQVRAIANLEESLKRDKPRALIQMATGSGKTVTAVSSIYRLIKYGGARRVLFVVDRSNLAEQAEDAFANYVPPDDPRKFKELYNVQRLTSNTLGSSSKVIITTIQRLYSMLKGEPDLDPEAEEGSDFEREELAAKEPLPVVYNPAIPIEFFDCIWIDEAHRSIYTLWRQVLEYFDAYLIGLTATPAKHTFGFFNQNLVMEYPHEEAVAEGVNVDFEVYRIRTRITEKGSRIEAGTGVTLPMRDRRTRALRWQMPDEDIAYEAKELDRNVVAKDQIRLIARTLRDKVYREAFPGRKEVPKTLIFAKDDSHAEDIVDMVREEFGRGNEFCTKITYKVTGASPKDLIQEFRTSYYPRIVVTVDLIATGTDIRPIECVVFMRSVKSRVLFEQMKGRGVRVINPNELKAVTPDAPAKTHFLIVDCVGITETEMADTQPLDRKRSVSLKALLDHVADGGTDEDILSSLASRLARLDKQCGEEERKLISDASGGATLKSIGHAIVEALEPDRQIAEARKQFALAPDQEPTEDQVKAAARGLEKEAVAALATQPKLRRLLVDLKKQLEQIIDEVSRDELVQEGTGLSEEAKEKAKALVQSFEAFIEDNKDEITALQFFYSVPHKDRLRYEDIKALADAIKTPPRSWTPEKIWRAYEVLHQSKVKGASSKRLLTDIVSLVRFALKEDEELVPHAERVRVRFRNWMAQQANRGRQFSEEQVRWLEMIRDHIATSLEIDIEDFDEVPFVQEGGLGKVRKVFGKEMGVILRELNEVLVA